MNQFIITEEFQKMFPNAQIGVIIARDLDNTEAGPRMDRAAVMKGLAEAEAAASDFLKAEVFSENPVISVWRQAFRQFKTKKSARSSIEALLKRIDKGHTIPSINPLVDLYNTVSLTYGLPCGGEDLDCFVGDLSLTLAEGGEPFVALGDTQRDDALPGELIYKDEAGAVCRCLNWRDGQRTMLTQETRNAFLVLESVDPSRSRDLQEALKMLAGQIEQYLGGRCEVHILGTDRWAVQL